MDLSPGTLSVFLVVQFGLLVFLAIRSWKVEVTRLFLLAGTLLELLGVGSLIRLQTDDSKLAGLMTMVELLSLATLNLTLWLAVCQMVRPDWKGVANLTRWFSLPYVAVIVLLAADGLGSLGWLIKGVNRVDGTFQTEFNGWFGYFLFVLGWLPLLGLLAVAGRHSTWRFLSMVLALGVGLLLLVAGLNGLTARSATGVFNLQIGLGLPLMITLFYLTWPGTLRQSAGARLDLALDALKEAVVLTDESGDVRYTNLQAATLGVAPGQTLAEALVATGVNPTQIDRTDPTGLATEQAPLLFTAADQQAEVKLTTLLDQQGQPKGHLIVGHDSGELERRNASLEQERARLDEAVERLNFLTTHDELTGLPNRRTLVEKLEIEVARIRSQGKFPGWEAMSSPYAPENNKSVLLFLDLDNFKLVNDTLGHGAGDQLLISLAQLIQEQLRPRDTLARFGGDEFAVLMPTVSVDQAQRMAGRLCNAVESYRFKLDGRNFELGLSIGLVVIEKQLSAQVVLTQADIAMYSAKEQGRNRVVVYNQNESSLAQLTDANQWAAQIKDALQEKRLVLHYQPIMRLTDRTVSHYEALIRMQDRQGQLIMPALFITAIEKFGLMNQVNRWIIQTVIQNLLDHPKANLFLNLSSRSLIDESLLHYIEAEVKHYGLRPGRLGIEITENLPIDDIDQAETSIQRLKAVGCSFALDDFGAGFNSFAYLGSLSVDKVKIDGSFIRKLDQDLHDQAIVRAIHNLAAGLNKETVAEFVTNEAIARILQDMGITYGQGYQLGKPNPRLVHHLQTQAQPVAI